MIAELELDPGSGRDDTRKLTAETPEELTAVVADEPPRKRPELTAVVADEPPAETPEELTALVADELPAETPLGFPRAAGPRRCRRRPARGDCQGRAERRRDKKFSSLPNPFSKTNLLLKYNKRCHGIRARVHVAKTHFHRCGRRRSRAGQFNEAKPDPGRSPG